MITAFLGGGFSWTAVHPFTVNINTEKRRTISDNQFGLISSCTHPPPRGTGCRGLLDTLNLFSDRATKDVRWCNHRCPAAKPYAVRQLIVWNRYSQHFKWPASYLGHLAGTRRQVSNAPQPYTEARLPGPPQSVLPQSVRQGPSSSSSSSI